MFNSKSTTIDISTIHRDNGILAIIRISKGHKPETTKSNDQNIQSDKITVIVLLMDHEQFQYLQYHQMV